MQAGVEIVSVERSAGRYRVTFNDRGTARRAEAEQFLIATGRRPNTSGFGLGVAGVTLGVRGEIVVNAFLQTASPDVYAAGDVIGDPMFVYVAAYGGALAAQAFGKDGSKLSCCAA